MLDSQCLAKLDELAGELLIQIGFGATLTLSVLSRAIVRMLGNYSY